MSAVWSASLGPSARPSSPPPPGAPESSLIMAWTLRRLSPLPLASGYRSAGTRPGQQHRARVCPHQPNTGLRPTHIFSETCLGADGRGVHGWSEVYRASRGAARGLLPPASPFRIPIRPGPSPTRLRSTRLIPHADARRIRRSSFSAKSGVWGSVLLIFD